MGQDQNWDDVGAAWDDIAESEEGESDGIRWADDAVGPAYIVKHHGYRGLQAAVDEMREEQGEEDSETVMGHDSPTSLTVTAVGEPVPIKSLDLPIETGSTTSSSDGSPIEKLGAALEAMQMDRGRARAQTPIGNGDVDW